MITYDCKRCVLILRIPYNRDFVETLKVSIPQRSRTWNPELKVWYIALPYFDTLTKILTKHFNIDKCPRLQIAN